MQRGNCQPSRRDAGHKNCLAAPSLPLPAEQRIGGTAMGRGLVAVGGNARHLGFKQGDTVVKFVLRIRAEFLGGELARGVALAAWIFWLFHRLHFRAGKRVLSMGGNAWSARDVAAFGWPVHQPRQWA
ncbi:hypothetical protein HME9302_02338 [Alteripontixanthobacter maritimus]|uniref:Uncharacterized protein n=1 Tax=Alteripontixanthobacter maritimus TaxID=2161824 RepID=A0A369QDX1_9SPHN|nr:hypothetical protein HME9302_02338 [Alteripontixanthobacter maritimus]